MNDTVRINGNPQKQDLTAAEQQLDAIIRPIIINTVNGLLITVQGVPAEVLVRLVARATGDIVGRMTSQGTLNTVLPIRAQAKEEFGKAIDGVRITLPMQQPPANKG